MCECDDDDDDDDDVASDLFSLVDMALAPRGGIGSDQGWWTVP